MDAIRKKMQSLKAETEGLYATIRGFEEATAEATARADQVLRKSEDFNKIVFLTFCRLIATSEIMERKFKTLRFLMMRSMTN